MKALLVFIVLAFVTSAAAQTRAQKVVFDSLGYKLPWWETSNTSVVNGVVKKRFFPYNSLCFRASAWGANTPLDTTNMSGGILHFKFRASKRCTISFWLSGDDSGAIKFKSFTSDTVWRSIDTAYLQLNPSRRQVNRLNIQNNCANDTVEMQVADLRFIARIVQPPIIAAQPSKISLVFKSDSVTHNDIVICVRAYDSLQILSAQLYFDSSYVSTLKFSTASMYSDTSERVTFVYSLAARTMCRDTLLLFLKLCTEDMTLGQHTVGVGVENAAHITNVRAYSFMLASRISTHDTLYVSTTIADSLRIANRAFNAALSQVPDTLSRTVTQTIQIAVPKPIKR